MMMHGRFVRTFAACASLALAVACQGKPPEHGTLIPDPPVAPPLHLTDADGHAFDLAARRGERTFIYFGYTHCPDACPTTLTDWARARALLGSRGSSLHFVFVSVDPERDTPQIARQYAHQFDSTFTGLVATPPQLDTIKAQWGFAVEREGMPGMKMAEYGVGHPAGVFFVDGDGKMKFVFAPDTKPADIATDIGRLP
jgi:protein SCO1/2